MSIKRRLLEKGKIVQKVLIDVLTDHEERIAALESNSQENTPAPSEPSNGDTPSEPSDDNSNDDDSP